MPITLFRSKAPKPTNHGGNDCSSDSSSGSSIDSGSSNKNKKRQRQKSLTIHVHSNQTIRTGHKELPLFYGNPETPAIIKATVVFETPSDCAGDEIEITFTAVAESTMTVSNEAFTGETTRLSTDEVFKKHRWVLPIDGYRRLGTIPKGRYHREVETVIDPLWPSSSEHSRGGMRYMFQARLVKYTGPSASLLSTTAFMSSTSLASVSSLSSRPPLPTPIITGQVTASMFPSPPTSLPPSPAASLPPSPPVSAGPSSFSSSAALSPVFPSTPLMTTTQSIYVLNTNVNRADIEGPRAQPVWVDEFSKKKSIPFSWSLSSRYLTLGQSLPIKIQFHPFLPGSIYEGQQAVILGAHFQLDQELTTRVKGMSDTQRVVKKVMAVSLGSEGWPLSLGSWERIVNVKIPDAESPAGMVLTPTTKAKYLDVNYTLTLCIRLKGGKEKDRQAEEIRSQVQVEVVAPRPVLPPAPVLPDYQAYLPPAMTFVQSTLPLFPMPLRTCREEDPYHAHDPHLALVRQAGPLPVSYDDQLPEYRR
ncbi:hypothetical protein BGW38_002661 [Lunasporangiospora selenospora]|uniref:Arrestin-like N-terminal domain-containing protein n=1 Tax=Lunasporangiospora selenospora TaxID=979761 RepID=A0A9P6G1N1_9FUNG|nr:hypothetical protein BGW38_002661 [Lunasporangiospora selenospora]